MKYMGDANWWDVRFNDRPLKLIGHEKILEDDINLFAEGASVLDVACGDGRNAIYLARMGYPMCRKTPSFSYGDIRHVHRIYASN